MRKYKAYLLREGDEIGIGIERHKEDNTLYIASIYVCNRISNKDIFDLIAFHSMKQLEQGESAILRVTLPMNAKYAWTRAYNGRIVVKKELNAHRPFIQTRMLAEDALRRKETIIEELNEGE